MIVKNEQDWVEGAVESVRSLLEEVIIVDTGSTDQTLQRIQRFNPRVIHFKWTNSFAEARNAGLEAAKFPWILVLDADERVAKRDLPLIARALHENVDGLSLAQRNYMMANHIVDWTPNDGSYEEGNGYPGFLDNPLVRLFRNKPEIRFQGSVHETIDPAKLSPKLKWKVLPVVLHHYGKLREPERMAVKQRLYLELGLKKAAEDPASGRAQVELGFQYHELGRYSEASEHFAKAYELDRSPRMLLYRAISEKQLLHYARAIELLQQAAKLGLDTFEVAIEMGNIHMLLGEIKEANAQFQKSLKQNPSSHLAAFNCGLAARRLDDRETSAKYYAKALELEPAYVKAALELASLELEKGCWAKALDLLTPVVRNQPGDQEARWKLAAAFLAAEQPDNAIETLAPAEASYPVVQYLLGTAYLQKNELDIAQRHLETAVKRDRTLSAARLNLAQVFRLKGDHARAARYVISAKGTRAGEEAGVR
jgi:glycosyltransferase involved in cell wall biosynthesis